MADREIVCFIQGGYSYSRQRKNGRNLLKQNSCSSQGCATRGSMKNLLQQGHHEVLPTVCCIRYFNGALYVCLRLGLIYRTKWQDVGPGLRCLQSCGGAETEIKSLVN